jgi:hypothetical protein
MPILRPGQPPAAGHEPADSPIRRKPEKQRPATFDLCQSIKTAFGRVFLIEARMSGKADPICEKLTDSPLHSFTFISAM